MSAGIEHFDLGSAPNRIRELREAAALTQKQLAERIGVSKVTISDLERAAMRLDVNYMRRLAPALGVRPADLLPAADNPESLSAFERKLIAHLRAVSADERAAIGAVMEILGLVQACTDTTPPDTTQHTPPVVLAAPQP
jgi:transcriptional regulator with XRE-family HTH domain